jgi:hypothetical protein
MNKLVALTANQLATHHGHRPQVAVSVKIIVWLAGWALAGWILGLALCTVLGALLGRVPLHE